MFDELRRFEKQVYSQGGEDGVLEHLFDQLGAGSKYFVEFGAWDGQRLSNTAYLREAHGWGGLLMEGDPERKRPGVQQELVTAENIEELFARYAVPERFDLLSIDVDGNDYWIWKALQSHRPRVVIIEYNVFFSTDVSKTMRYDPEYSWDQSYYHGASLGALRNLGRRKDYSLVHTDSFAPNAIFVCNEELPSDWVERPLADLTYWDWDPGTEPPIDAERSWVAV